MHVRFDHPGQLIELGQCCQDVPHLGSSRIEYGARVNFGCVYANANLQTILKGCLAHRNKDGPTQSLQEHHNGSSHWDVLQVQYRLHGSHWDLETRTNAGADDNLVTNPF